MELEAEAGIVSNEAKDSFLDCIKEEVEVNDGEANRIRKDAEEFALLQTRAKDREEAVVRQSLREVVCSGKGDGKGGKHNPRYTPIPKKHSESASVAAITGLAARAKEAEAAAEADATIA